MIEKKQYSTEFKRESFRQQQTSDNTVIAVARELGLSHGLRRRMKCELDIVQQERDILKKQWASSLRMSNEKHPGSFTR